MLSLTKLTNRIKQTTMRKYIKTLSGIGLLAFFLLLQSPDAKGQNGYQRPPEAIAKLIDAPATPAVSIDSKAQWMLLMERPGYPSIEEVAAPELRIGGTRINPAHQWKEQTKPTDRFKPKEHCYWRNLQFCQYARKPGH